MRRLLITTVFVIAAAVATNQILRAPSDLDRITARAISPDGRVPAAMRSLRPNYPYSVIAGGAYSAAELRIAVAKDALVREHYAGFGTNAARLVTLNQDRYQYVSFRQNNKIFWTRNRLRIPKGEILLTDGRNFARTRCGNRLSSDPKRETATAEPSQRLLSLPPFTPALLREGEIQLADAPPVEELAQAIPPLPLELPALSPFVSSSDLVATAKPIGDYAWANSPFEGYIFFWPALSPQIFFNPPPPIETPVTVPPVSAVPEPAYLSLLGLGSLGSLWVFTRRCRASKRRSIR